MCKTKILFFISIVAVALLCNGCPNILVNALEKNNTYQKPDSAHKPIYLSNPRNFAINIDSISEIYYKNYKKLKDYNSNLSKDTLSSNDTIFEDNVAPIKFTISAINSDGFPDSVMLKLIVYDTTGKYIAGLAPPYYNGKDDYKSLWFKLTDSCENANIEISDYEVKEIRDGGNRKYAFAYILDNSGSMGEHKIKSLSEAVKFILKAIKPGDMVTVIAFRTNSDIIVPLTSDRKNFLNFEDSKKLKGGTAIYDAIQTGVNELNKAPQDYVKSIILFSDGSDGSSTIKLDSAMILCKNNNVPVYSVTYGMRDSNMANIARYSKGRYYNIVSTKEIPFVFRDIYLSIMNYYQITYKAPECKNKHFVSAFLQFPNVEDHFLQANGMYDKSLFSPLDPEGTTVLMNIEFESGKAVINKESIPLLNNVVSALNQNPEIKIKIIGHTDDIGTEQYNLELSKKRAEAVKDMLINMGIDKIRIQTSGFGETKPLVSNSNEENRQKNRRTEFVIVK